MSKYYDNIAGGVPLYAHTHTRKLCLNQFRLGERLTFQNILFHSNYKWILAICDKIVSAQAIRLNVKFVLSPLRSKWRLVNRHQLLVSFISQSHFLLWPFARNSLPPSLFLVYSHNSLLLILGLVLLPFLVDCQVLSNATSPWKQEAFTIRFQ